VRRSANARYWSITADRSGPPYLPQAF